MRGWGWWVDGLDRGLGASVKEDNGGKWRKRDDVRTSWMLGGKYPAD